MLIKMDLSWLFGNKNNHFTGVLPDPRASQEKQCDYLHEERAAAVSVDPFSNKQITVSPYFYENQNRTYSCVPHGVGLGLGIERKNDVGSYQRIAQMFPYRLRQGYPAEGSYLQN